MGDFDDLTTYSSRSSVSVTNSECLEQNGRVQFTVSRTGFGSEGYDCESFVLDLVFDFISEADLDWVVE